MPSPTSASVASRKAASGSCKAASRYQRDAAALSVWRPVAKDRHEILRTGVPFLKNLAKACGV